MKAVFRLSLVTILRTNTVYLVLALAVILPFLLPELTNYHVDKEVIEPARAQAAWQFSWVIGMFWLLYQAASLGGEFSKSGLGVYFSSGGCRKGAQLTGIWCALLMVLIPLCLIPAVISWLAASPADVLAAKHWGVLCVQHFIFMVMVFGGLSMLALGMSSRFGVIIGYMVALAVALIGFYGVGILEKMVYKQTGSMVDMLYIVLPHFYLGDLTHRFVSQQGALTTVDFVAIFEYMSGWFLLLTGIGAVVYSPEK